MAVSPLAGKLPTKDSLIDVDQLNTHYFQHNVDPSKSDQLVKFGTSGHRGSSFEGTFNEPHILAIAQAIADYRKQQGITGPLYLGKDSHALSEPAQISALEVLSANGVDTIIQQSNGFTPTPVISRSIINHNRNRTEHLADGIVITPSHNPPADGGFKYNAINGGPADVDATDWIQNRANELIRGSNADVKRNSLKNRSQSNIHERDLATDYISDLVKTVDMEIISKAKVKIGVDPLGGASVNYWDRIADLYKLDLTVVNYTVDPTFSFMTVDHDGKIRMDCSSPYAMASLVGLKSSYQIAFGNDTDADRHGIVTPSGGLMNPNHFLAVSIEYLLKNRSGWRTASAVGKTAVSTALIDKVVKEFSRRLYEVPVGFKWFAPGLFDGTCCFGGEESAGASFLQRDGAVWTTDKDGLILGLLAAEITATTNKDPSEIYKELENKFGNYFYKRVDVPTTKEIKAKFKTLSPTAVTIEKLAGSKITSKLTTAPGNEKPLGGLKVVSENGWFAVRPSGTEEIYKVYAESFESQKHLDEILASADRIVRELPTS